MREPRAVGIYARISQDSDGLGAGVARQIEDCRAAAKQLGWTVADEYVDNDVSAYSGKRRPEFERMLTDLGDGLVDGVIVWHIDRLVRQNRDLERFLDVVEAARVESNVKCVTGDVDLTTPQGLLVARLMAGIANMESADKSRRVKRKIEQKAREGLPHKGSKRPFGYEADFIAHNSNEAKIVADLVARYIAGEPLNSLAYWLIDNEIPTVTGRPWSRNALYGMLANPRYAGLREHNGEVIGRAVWEPIITEDQHRQVLAIMERNKGNRRPPQRYLLSGLLVCSKCGMKLQSIPRGTLRRYVCMPNPNRPKACGGISISANGVEQIITEAVLYRLDSPELADTMNGRASADRQTVDLADVLDQAKAQLEELAIAYGSQQITAAEWFAARKPIEGRLEAAERQIAQLTQTHSLLGLVGNGDELRRTWESLNLSRQHAIVRALIDHAVIHPGTPKANRVEPSRVEPIWRV